MPIFCIHGLDRKGSGPVRLANYDAHKAYLGTAAQRGVTILASGPLVDETGETMIGSLLIVEADDLATARAFNDADPFARAGVWASVSINRFNLRQGRVGP